MSGEIGNEKNQIQMGYFDGFRTGVATLYTGLKNIFKSSKKTVEAKAEYLAGLLEKAQSPKEACQYLNWVSNKDVLGALYNKLLQRRSQAPFLETLLTTSMRIKVRKFPLFGAHVDCEEKYKSLFGRARYFQKTEVGASGVDKARAIASESFGWFEEFRVNLAEGATKEALAKMCHPGEKEPVLTYEDQLLLDEAVQSAADQGFAQLSVDDLKPYYENAKQPG